MGGNCLPLDSERGLLSLQGLLKFCEKGLYIFDNDALKFFEIINWKCARYVNNKLFKQSSWKGIDQKE
jgi:hypothetical protein